jgi:hypothetical protein
MRHMKIFLRLAGVSRRADRWFDWWSYVGSFGDDFFSDEE